MLSAGELELEQVVCGGRWHRALEESGEQTGWRVVPLGGGPAASVQLWTACGAGDRRALTWRGVVLRADVAEELQNAASTGWRVLAARSGVAALEGIQVWVDTGGENWTGAGESLKALESLSWARQEIRWWMQGRTEWGGARRSAQMYNGRAGNILVGAGSNGRVSWYDYAG